MQGCSIQSFERIGGGLMHYYKRNLGDYAKKAGRLSMLQHGAYTLLIDSCYDREKFPTLDDAIDWTWASTDAEIEAVKFVLSRFFHLSDDGTYTQDRILQELTEYHAKAKTNKRIAIDRETKRKEKSTNREQVVNESPPNQEPRTINQEPILNTSSKKTSSAKASNENLPIPDFVEIENWNNYLEVRKGLKAKNTVQAIKALATQLKKLVAEGFDANEVVLQSIRSSWKDLYPIKKTFNGSSFGQREQGRSIAAKSIFTTENTLHLQGNQSKLIEVENEPRAITA
jgi:uncharacterized protein YdaU (DUF1376 family)